jgi:hypothetical protein
MSEPPLVHLFQKLLGDGITGGIAEDGVGIAVRTEGCGLFARDIVGHFGGREDVAAEEAATLFRPLYLLTVGGDCRRVPTSWTEAHERTHSPSGKYLVRKSHLDRILNMTQVSRRTYIRILM